MTNIDPAPIVARYRARVERFTQELYRLENEHEAMLAQFDDEIAPLILAGQGGTPAKVIFASPVTGKVGDVWGVTDGLKWFVATPYGKRYENRPGVFSYHTGVDLNLPNYADSGKPIYAAADGEIVVSAAINGWQGLMVVIEHVLEDGSKCWTRYAHLQKTIGLGNVKRGQIIGYVGDYAPVGAANDHCHYDVALGVDLGAHPADWPGLDAQRLKQYANPETWHTERGA